MPWRIQECDLAHSSIHRNITGVGANGLRDAASLPCSNLQEWQQVWAQGKKRCPQRLDASVELRQSG